MSRDEEMRTRWREAKARRDPGDLRLLAQVWDERDGVVAGLTKQVQYAIAECYRMRGITKRAGRLSVQHVSYVLWRALAERWSWWRTTLGIRVIGVTSESTGVARFFFKHVARVTNQVVQDVLESPPGDFTVRMTREEVERFTAFHGTKKPERKLVRRRKKRGRG